MFLYRLPRDISKPYFADVNKSDAKKLISWYNAHTKYYHFIQKQRFGKLYNIIRYET
jgi:hypothetical protein